MKKVCFSIKPNRMRLHTIFFRCIKVYSHIRFRNGQLPIYKWYREDKTCPSVRWIQELWFVAREVNVTRSAPPSTRFNSFNALWMMIHSDLYYRFTT